MGKEMWCLIFGCITVIIGGFAHDLGYINGAGSLFACSVILWAAALISVRKYW